MTAPDLPMPSGGGTYLRDPVTGALTEVLPDAAPVAAPAAAPDAADEAQPVPAHDPAPAKGRKQPLKEG